MGIDKNRQEGGLSYKGIRKTSASGKPLISVVSVCLNDREGLEKTIKSVINQVYDNIEFLIVDGGSYDGSTDVIKKYAEFIDYWVSEPDGGIYFGMNKGIKKASGKWIIFMNSGDTFYSCSTVGNVVEKMDKIADVVYGDHIYRKIEYGDLHLRRKAGRLKDLWKGMVFCHQAMFTKSSILKEKGFDCNYKVLADYDLILKLYHEKYTFQKVDEIIVVFISGGESYLKKMKALSERASILKRYEYNNAPGEVYLPFLLSKARIVNIMEKYLPNKLLCVLYWLRHRQFNKILRRKNIFK